MPAATADAPGPLKRPGEVSGKYKDYLNQRYANSRDAKAVIHLFARKQTGGALWLGSGAVFIPWASSQTGTTRSNSGTTTFTITPLGYIAMFGLFGGVGIGKIARFGNTRLYEALMEYDNTKTFPGYVDNKLKDKDYK